MARALREGKEYNGEEIAIERPDRSRWIALAHANPFFDEAGRVTGAVNILLDITARKRAEAQQQQAEEVSLKLAAIVESSDDAIISKDMNGTITSWNKGAERLYGYTAEEMVGKSISRLIPADHADDFPAIVARLRRGERIEHHETVRLRKDGTPLDVSLTISPVRDAEGHVIGASKIARDITERKQAQRRLAAELAATQALQEVSMQMIEEGNVQSLCERILDAAVAIMRSDMATMQIVDEAQDALQMLCSRGFDPDFGKVFELNRPDTRTSCSMARRLGRRVIVPDVETCEFIAGASALEEHRKMGIAAVQSTPLLSRSGHVLGMISTYWRKPHQPVESELRLMDVLARQAADLIERRRTEDMLKDADRRKDEFLAVLAHELRNPLAPLRNGLQIIGLAGDNSPAVAAARPMMERQLGHMVRLIDDLLDLSRITHGKIELRKEQLDLPTIVRDAVETSRPHVEAAGHQLTVSLPPTPVLVYGDRIRLAQIITNLLINSARYTERGGRIWLTAERQGSDAVVSVKDTGIGVSADMLPKIFDSFTQADTARDRAPGGLGLGLHLVKRLVEMHGGTVEARSDGRGKGSEFVVRLSVVLAPERSADQEGGGDGESPRASYRILIVDDNRDSALSFAMLLEMVGHQPQTAHDGLGAVEAARRFQPDVVLMDIGLPKLNGYDACRCIRAQPWGERMVLIALTGWGQEKDKRLAKEAGFDFHLLKPVKLADLEKLLDGLLLARRPAASPSDVAPV